MISKFTISFSLWLGLNWIDNRLQINAQNNTRRGVIHSTDNKVVALQRQSKKILQYMWLPEVYIPHQQLSKCSHGVGLYDEVVNFFVKNDDVWVDYWSLVKPTITCSMAFNWFPFDEQNCNFIIQVISD